MWSTFLSALTLPGSRSPPAFLAARFVAKNILMVDKTGVDTADYDAFLAFFEELKERKRSSSLHYDVAALHLTHPSRPSPYALLDHCRAKDVHGTPGSVPDQVIKPATGAQQQLRTYCLFIWLNPARRRGCMRKLDGSCPGAMTGVRINSLRGHLKTYTTIAFSGHILAKLPGGRLRVASRR